jgi:hypothetical protein
MLTSVTFDFSKNYDRLLRRYLIFAGFKKNRLDTVSIKSGVIILALIFAGYFFVHVLTPNDMNWHLNTTLRRSFLLIWPCFGFSFFMAVKTPGNVSMANRQREPGHKAFSSMTKDTSFGCDCRKKDAALQ